MGNCCKSQEELIPSQICSSDLNNLNYHPKQQLSKTYTQKLNQARYKTTVVSPSESQNSVIFNKMKYGDQTPSQIFSPMNKYFKIEKIDSHSTDGDKATEIQAINDFRSQNLQQIHHNYRKTYSIQPVKKQPMIVGSKLKNKLDPIQETLSQNHPSQNYVVNNKINFVYHR